MNWKFRRIVRNMPLDPIMDTVSEDRHSASSMVLELDGDHGPPLLIDSDGEFENAIGTIEDESDALYRRVWTQIHRSIRRLFDFFLENIVLNTIKLVETCWLIFLQLWAVMLRCWLGFFKRINRCVGTLCCCGGAKPKTGRYQMAPSDTSGDETTDHEEAAKEPVLVVINLDTVLVHASSKQPKFVSPFDKPQQASTNLPFKITLKESGALNGTVYVHPRPYLTRFLQQLHELNGKVEVALHTIQSAEFLTEVLKWIDGYGHCKHLFYGARYGEEEDEEAIITGNLSKDIEAIYTQVRGEQQPPMRDDVRNALREAGSSYDQAEDMTRPESLRIQQMHRLRNPIQRKVLLIDDCYLPSGDPYCKNLVNVKAWKDDDQRDQTLFTTYGILENVVQMHRPVFKSLPHLLNLAKTLGGDMYKEEHDQ